VCYNSYIIKRGEDEMNKTEKKLMEIALEEGQVAIDYGYITYRKNSRFGARVANAALSLENAGFLKLISITHRCEPIGACSTIHTTTVKYELVVK